MTRVLMVADGMWNGGAERQLALLCSSLPEGWSAAVLSMEDGPYRPVLERAGIDLRLAPRRYRFDVTPAFRMWRAAAEIRPDVVHSWGWMSTLAMAPFCRARGIPLLNGTIRRGDLPPRRARMYRLGMSLSDAIVANSRAGLAAFGIPEGERGHVVYNGFDPTRLATIGPRATGTPARASRVAVMAARMFPGKDWRLLLDAARVLARDDDGWRFLAIGSGPERDTLMSQAADLVQQGVVDFPEGGLEALPLIAEADIGLLLTNPAVHAEGCSNSIMEYMACGLPVVCTDSGGNPEIVANGVSGLLVAPRDVNGLVSALRALGSDPVLALRMGREGRLRIETCFTIEEMVARYVTIYEALLGPRS